MKRTKRTLSLLVALAMVLLSATTAFAGTYSIFGDDNRVRVTSSSGSNYSICKIKITFDNGDVEYGTGFLISSTEVVTAGHCLHYKKKDGTPKTAKKLELFFGCSGTNTNYTYKAHASVDCTSKNIYYPPEWANKYYGNYDYGVIKLDEAVVGPATYFELSTISSPEGEEINITGYEGHLENTVFSNWELVRGTGKITSATNQCLFTQVDAMPGQSGAPVVHKGKVVGIYTYSAASGRWVTEPSTEANQITRINSIVSDRLINAFQE